MMEFAGPSLSKWLKNDPNAVDREALQLEIGFRVFGGALADPCGAEKGARAARAGGHLDASAQSLRTPETGPAHTTSNISPFFRLYISVF
jgi:hypothetical protein